MKLDPEPIGRAVAMVAIAAAVVVTAVVAVTAVAEVATKIAVAVVAAETIANRVGKVSVPPAVAGESQEKLKGKGKWRFTRLIQPLPFCFGVWRLNAALIWFRIGTASDRERLIIQP